MNCLYCHGQNSDKCPYCSSPEDIERDKNRERITMEDCMEDYDDDAA